MVKTVAKFVRDLLGYDQQLIRIGRENFTREQFETEYIVIDSLAVQQRISELETYDGTGEVLSLGAMMRATVTLDFYGSGAYTRAIDFMIRSRSQTGLELKQSLGLDILQPRGPTDVKALTGQQYGERVQLEMTVVFSQSIDINTLRIDEAQIEISNEEGLQNG